MKTIESPPLQSNVSLRSFTTLKVGGPARYLAQVTSLDQLVNLVQWASSEKMPWTVIGKGSNLLVPDSGFDGLVIINRLLQEDWCVEEDTAYVWVGAGENLAALAARTAKDGWAGLEFACGIPGSVGGAVAMNAGAHGRSVSDSLVEVVSCSREGVKTLGLEELEMQYRHSRFLKNPEVVVAARFRLSKDVNVRERLREMTNYRLSTQPWKAATAGCFFRNPENCHVDGRKCSAGYLIEKAGLKGYVHKGAKVSEIHANFLVNHSQASAQDFLELCDLIREKVYQEFGVQLQGEVRFLQHSCGPIDYV